LHFPVLQISKLDRVDIICVSLAAVLTFAKPFQHLMLYTEFRRRFGSFSEVLDKQARLSDKQLQSRGGDHTHLIGDNDRGIADINDAMGGS